MHNSEKPVFKINEDKTIDTSKNETIYLITLLLLFLVVTNSIYINIHSIIGSLKLIMTTKVTPFILLLYNDFPKFTM